MVVCREQAISAEGADFLQRTDDGFLESLLVAQILCDAVAGREEHLLGHVESHYGACVVDVLVPMERKVLIGSRFFLNSP
jgi:hypothetical protein